MENNSSVEPSTTGRNKKLLKSSNTINKNNKVNHCDNTSTQSSDNGKIKSKRKRKSSHRKRKEKSKDTCENTKLGNAGESRPRNPQNYSIDDDVLNQEVQGNCLHSTSCERYSTKSDDCLDCTKIEENDADDEEDKCEVYFNSDDNNTDIESTVRENIDHPMISTQLHTQRRTISETSCVAADNDAISSTPISQLSCSAPEFIPTTETSYKNVMSFRIPYHVPVVTSTYVDEELLNELNQIGFQYNFRQIPNHSEKRYYSEEPSVISPNTTIQRQQEAETYLQPFNISSISNDSGILSECLRSPFSPNDTGSSSPLKFHFRNTYGYQDENYNVVERMDYDSSFPPLHRYDKKKNVSLQSERNFETNKSTYATTPTSKQEHKPTARHEKSANNRTNGSYLVQKRSDQAKRACVYCKRMGRDESMFDSHCLRNPISQKLMCPLLVDNICEICGDTKDDNVHTTNECKNRTPMNTGFKSFQPLLKENNS